VRQSITRSTPNAPPEEVQVGDTKPLRGDFRWRGDFGGFHFSQAGHQIDGHSSLGPSLA
jgi:hypothetical protein